MVFSKKTYGISIESNTHLNDDLALVEVDLKEGKADIVETQVSNFSGVLTSVKNAVVHACFSSSSIITFESDQEKSEDALGAFLPGVDPETFLIQRFENHFAILNKEELNSFLLAKKEEGLQINNLVLEPIVLLALQRATGQEEILGNKFQTSGSEILSVGKESNNATLSVDNRALNKSEYLAFGSTISKQVLDFEEHNLPETLSSLAQNQSEETKFKTVLMFCVGALMFFTVGNAFYFSHLTSLNQKLDVELYSSNASQEKLDVLKLKVKEYLQLRSGLNAVSAEHGAYLLDLIGKSLPKEIIFKSINLEAPDKIKEGYQIKFNDGLLIIEGKTTSTMALNNWIDEVSKAGWVDDVKLLSYEDSKEKRGNFKLQLFLENA